jgi:outer membrane protein TolC
MLFRSAFAVAGSAGPLSAAAARGAALVLVSAPLVLSGCANPLAADHEEKLRDQLIASHRAYLQAVAAGPVVQVQRASSEVEQELTREGRIEELDRISGPRSYQDMEPALGTDLMGQAQTPAVNISLQRAIQMAVRHNLDVQVARMTPAVAQAQLARAQAAFDAVFFTNFDYQNLDTPQPGGTIASLSGNQQVFTQTLATGIRKPLTTGGQITAQTSFTRNFREPTYYATDTYEQADVLLSVQQPLLRNFGADINTAQIQVNELARQNEVQNLRTSLLKTAEEVERAYWSLVFARARLLAEQRLLERTNEDRDRLIKRREFDTSPVRVTEANSFVELRRADVIRARQNVRIASDQLKQLINDPDLPVSSETLLVPQDPPVDVTVSFSLLDAVTTALRRRPEVESALLAIKDATIRQRVADNQRLPQLNLNAALRYNGVGDSTEGAYDSLDDGQFIDYILGVQFEMPIGNRDAQALFTQRQLERRQAVLNYQRAAQIVVVEVKNALRQLITSYELIGAARAARRAASDSLRAIEEQEKAGVALTPEFLLDLKLSAQQRLADAEVQEAQAMTDYNAAVASLYRAMGTLLERNGIRFDPDADAKAQDQ